MKRKIASILLVILSACLLAGVAVAAAQGASQTAYRAPDVASRALYAPDDLTPTDYITVTTTGDEGGLSERCDTVVTCTLRRAINQVRWHSAPSRVFRIAFDIPITDTGYDSDAGAWIIAVDSDNSSSEPFAFRDFGTSGQVIIDGWTQPDYESKRADAPRIVLRGDNYKGVFTLTGGNNVIRGLAFQGFGDWMVSVPGTSNNLVEENWFGLTVTGTDIYLRNLAYPEDGSGEAGIYVQSGGATNTVQNNILVGFKGVAINVDSDNSFILSNTVGTRADGTVPDIRPERHCKPNARYYNWFAGAGVDVGGHNNLIQNNRVVGMLFQSDDPLNTPDDAIAVTGWNHVVRYNIIGLTSDDVPFGVCDEGIYIGGASGGHSIQILTNTIVGPHGEAGIKVAGGQFGYDLNQITAHGNVIRDTAFQAFAFGKLLPSTLREFNPAVVTSIVGVNVIGTDGANSECADCTVELFLDRVDMVTETLESLATVTADANGDWAATLPRTLAITEGIRTASTTAHDGQITHPSGVYSTGMTTRISVIYTQTGAPSPVPPVPPAPLPPAPIVSISYMPPPTVVTTYTTIITVNSATDPDDQLNYVCYATGLTGKTPQSPCTLRRALVEADSLMDEDPTVRPVLIRFDIPTSDPQYDAANGVWIIQVADVTTTVQLDAFPTLGSTDIAKSGQVVIDGWTQPDYESKRADAPRIIVRGPQNREVLGHGLVVNGNGNTVRGLAFQDLRMVLQFNHGYNVIEDNWFGLSVDGQSIYLKNEDAPEDGSGQSGVTLAANASSNLIKNNRLAGYRGAALNVESDDSYIVGNTVGTRADGTVSEVAFSRWCRPNARYYNWFGGAGVEVGGKRNQVKDNIIAGLLWYSADPENTPDTALEVKGQDHLVQNNRIGVDANDQEVGTCGRGIVIGSEYTNILTNTVVRTKLEAFRLDGTVVEINAVYLQGNVARDNTGPGASLLKFGTTVPEARAIFTPAQVITIAGTLAEGVSGEEAPCPYCRVELFLDDLDDITDTYETLAVAYADVNGDWTATLPRPLVITEGIRTASTILNYGVIPGFDYPSTSRFSLVYSQTGAVPPSPPPDPVPSLPPVIPDPVYAAPPEPPVSYVTHITVTTSDDGNYANTCADVAADQCCLRRAINQVNALAAGARPARIAFDIPTSDAGHDLAGFWTITLTSALPAVTGGQVTFDGSTQPNARSGAPAIIILRDSNAGADLQLGETQYEDSYIVRGLAFQSVMISMTGDGNIIEDNWMGLTDDGADIYFPSDSSLNDNKAIIQGASDSGHHLIQNNILAGSRTNAINVQSDDNLIEGNAIGLAANGTIPITPAAGTICKPDETTDNWFGGGGIYLTGERNRIISNTIAGLLIRGSATTTPPDAIALPSGLDNLIQNNRIGQSAAGDDLWTCGSGLDLGSSFNRVYSNTIAGSFKEGIFINGTVIAINANAVRGNVISDCVAAIEFGDAVPEALSLFQPALATVISGTAVSGISDDDCPYCWVDVYLDDDDSTVEALEHLGATIADVNGRWSLTLPAPLASNQGLRTISTARDYGVINMFEAETSSKLSILFTEQPPTAPSSVTITPPTSGLVVGQPCTFVANVLPVTATLPITYTWQATDYTPQVASGGPQNSASFTWSSAGDKHVTVTVANGIGSPVSHHVSVTITSGDLFEVYLPIVLKNL